MSGRVSADAEELRAAQRLVSGIVEEMRQEFEKLVGRGDALAGGWLGVSASRYRPGWEEWKQGGKAVIEALEGESGLLGESTDEYDQTEGENQRGIAQVDVRFNW